MKQKPLPKLAPGAIRGYKPPTDKWGNPVYRPRPGVTVGRVLGVVALVLAGVAAAYHLF
jgi:hypothetical protein